MPLNQAVKKNSHVLWLLSLIQDVTPDAQTKAEFSEMADDLLKTDTIDKITLCYGDTLQRFRLMIQNGSSEEEAALQCRQMAKTWYADNANALEKLKETKNLSILTWDEFLAWPEYADTVRSVERLYKENTKFRRDVDGRIRQELNKIKNDAKISDPIQQTELLKKYLFEECAFQKFAALRRFNYELYKNPLPPAARDIKGNSEFVPPGFLVELYFTQFSRNDKKNPMIPSSTLPNNTMPSTEKHQSTIDIPTPLDYHLPPCGIDMPSHYNNKKTYYYPSERKLREESEKNAFCSIFTAKKSPVLTESHHFSHEMKPSSQKIAEFIEKTLELIPEKDKEEAITLLFNVTTQKLIPLCGFENKNSLKI